MPWKSSSTLAISSELHSLIRKVISQYTQKDLIRKINENDGNVAILTDFDCAGIHIAEKVIAEDIEE